MKKKYNYLLLILALLFSINACSINENQKSNNEINELSEEFNELKYPDFYKEIGKAEINKDVEKGKIIYSKLDKLKRTGAVYANLSYKNIIDGKNERSDINNIFPSGWSKNKKVIFKFFDNKTYKGYFYNRSHLLGHSLGGDDKKYNLITGTRTQNVGRHNNKGGMQYAEMIAYNYLTKNKDKTLYYFVEPIYKGNELLARYVIINMLSEDKTIDKKIKVFNNAPNFVINYRNGNFLEK